MPKGCAWPLVVKAAPCLIPFTHASKYFSTHIFQELGPFLFPYHEELAVELNWTEEVSCHWFTVLLFDVRFWIQSVNRLKTGHSSTNLFQSLLLLLPGLLQFFSAVQFWNVWQFLSGRLWKDPVSLLDLQKTLQSKVQRKAAMVINSRPQFI